MTGINFVPSFFSIASGVMLIHYRYCLEVFQRCPSPVAVGPKGTGKTTAGKVFLSLVGQGKKNLQSHTGFFDTQFSEVNRFPAKTLRANIVANCITSCVNNSHLPSNSDRYHPKFTFSNI